MILSRLSTLPILTGVQWCLLALICKHLGTCGAHHLPTWAPGVSAPSLLRRRLDPLPILTLGCAFSCC